MKIKEKRKLLTYPNQRRAATAIRAANAVTNPQRLSWNEAWLAIREAIRPFPEAAKAVGAIVDRLIAEVDAFGDPGPTPNAEQNHDIPIQ